MQQAELPHGSDVKGIYPSGASYWTRTAEIQTQQADGSSMSFFLKVTHSETGKAMVSGEYKSMETLHATVPYLTPKPYGWGTFATDSNIHFFLCGFVKMDDDLPDSEILAAGLADLHTKAVSPTGDYGFYVPTLQGTIPQYTEWTDSWEVFFSESTRLVMQNEEKSQGSDPELQELCHLVSTAPLAWFATTLESNCLVRV